MNPKTFGRNAIRVVAAAAVLGLSVSVGAGTAFGDKTPAANSSALPANDTPHPEKTTEAKPNTPCASSQPAGDVATVPTPQRVLGLEKAWQFSTGAGQTVAVIDTGVARNPRLANLAPGGDYVSTGDGTQDCDGHGTAVAGLIAASRVDGQGFAGVAPGAKIIGIRQTSNYFEVKGTGTDEQKIADNSVGNLNTLASAIRHAADLGATVINISEIFCSNSVPPDSNIGAAVQYAAVQKDVVVVVAAGNNDACKSVNPVLDPTDPTGDQWSRIIQYVSPARWDKYVLSVGSIDPATGSASKFTVPGPWVGVAAPGQDITSLDLNYAANSKYITTGLTHQGKMGSIEGTSFSSPYVAGLAALVRAKFPRLSAAEVIKRIEATAHAPAGGWDPYVGYGAIDPVAALTADVPTQLPPKQPFAAQSWRMPVPQPPKAPDNTARNVALIGTAVIAVLLILGYLASFPIRRRLGMHD
ncbi:type VII secretion-associated serine protease mycosin [Nocardia macrotermitis]|uniref:Mycosin-3 n=1 Tax=Nocardia macrotermitis TaxID=2585198 RepID=A0A7K0D1J4_9NOCA|nr:type VII secretion-associated serine protease mycosin [Nocardia macrotermitis]MQY19589.1 Mycosin-3 [Nocardia macrotermitis]